ncbi:pyridoxal phosphate-dependent aminotransferase [Rhodovibrionaceae bacterium A322]
MSAAAFPAPLRPEIMSLEMSRIQQIFELGVGRDDVFPLYVGQGDEGTPAFICDAATEALNAGHTFYTHKRGLPELRQALADYNGRLFQAGDDPERITVTGSGMHAITIILQAILSPGEKVIVVSPVWPNIMAAITIAGGQVTPVTLDPTEDGGFHLDLDKLAAAVDDKTRAIFIASPGNPTGWMMESEEQQVVLDLCREKKIWYLADEVYHRFTFDREVAPSVVSLAQPEDPVISINSFSKSWAMTGWRHGWLTHPASLGTILTNMIEFTNSGTQAFLQYGCLAAIEQGEDYVKRSVEICRTSGEVAYQALAALPRVKVARPRAAFYSFFAVEGVTDSLAFAKQILNESGVGLAPGSAFGPGGEGYLRLCFASSETVISTAMDKLRHQLA